MVGTAVVGVREIVVMGTVVVWGKVVSVAKVVVVVEVVPGVGREVILPDVINISVDVEGLVVSVSATVVSTTV